MQVVPQLFLSYAREDKKPVEQIYERLMSAGYKPWMDTKDLLPGEDWEPSIRRAIRASSFFIFCLSPHSVSKRGFCRKEIKIALDIWDEKLNSDIYLIPVRLVACDAPEELRRFQWVELSDKESWGRMMEALKVGIERQAATGKPAVRQVDLFDAQVLENELNTREWSPPLDRSGEKLKTLDSELRFVESHKHEQVALDRIPSIVALARECSTTDPEAVAFVFRRLDKFLKCLGDRRLVLEVAELSIKNARSCPKPRKPEVVDAEAQALICGISWVHQRLGRLDMARVAAEESLRLGEKVKSGVNTSYCTKCIGRLCRMEAEATQDQRHKEAKLHESVARLEQAVDLFSQLDRYGPMHPEVGDCYCLLGRTYLVAKNFSKAEEAIRKAYERITEKDGKDYLDLTLLSADLEAERGNKRDASNYYDQALCLPVTTDPEITEMRARGHFKRGRNRVALKDAEGAKLDFQEAARIWQSLGEIESAKDAEWEEILLSEKLQSDVLTLLGGEEPWVRVEAIKLYKQRVASVNGGGKRVAQRADPGREYWRRLVDEAKARTA